MLLRPLTSLLMLALARLAAAMAPAFPICGNIAIGGPCVPVGGSESAPFAMFPPALGDVGAGGPCHGGFQPNLQGLLQPPPGSLCSPAIPSMGMGMGAGLQDQSLLGLGAGVAGGGAVPCASIVLPEKGRGSLNSFSGSFDCVPKPDSFGGAPARLSDYCYCMTPSSRLFR